MQIHLHNLIVSKFTKQWKYKSWVYFYANHFREARGSGSFGEDKSQNYFYLMIYFQA